MDSSDSDEDEEIVSRGYKRAAWCIVLLGLLITLGGLPQVPVLLHYHQPLGFAPSPDSSGVLGHAQLQRHFPGVAEAAEAPVVLLIRSTKGSSVLNPQVPSDTEVLLTGNPVIEYERFFDRSIELLLRAELCLLPLTTMIFICLVRPLSFQGAGGSAGHGPGTSYHQ
eukprot:Skav204548  [mRNA]  locus=scaffold3346:109131:111015:- [translate_table: standard]